MANTFEYMLLDRCKQDCEYYLGNGNKQNKYLWAGNPRDHIKKMIELFRSVPESPEWLTIEQIKDYAERMGVLTDFFFVEVMAELKCLAEENPPENANYWLEENRVNIFGYIEDNGNDDRWIALLLEIHGDTFESIEYGIDEVDENELAEKVREILNDYNEKWRIQK